MIGDMLSEVRSKVRYWKRGQNVSSRCVRPAQVSLPGCLFEVIISASTKAQKMRGASCCGGGGRSGRGGGGGRGGEAESRSCFGRKAGENAFVD